MSEDNSIIDSEIAEFEEEERRSTTNTNTGDGTPVSDDVIGTRTPSANIKDNVSENYSEEFENTEEVDDIVDGTEDVEESVASDDSSDGAEQDPPKPEVHSSTPASNSSRSVRIRCEINILNSAVKSSPEPEPVPSDHEPKESKGQFSMDNEVRSLTPSDCNEESHLFDMSILNESMVNLLILEEQRMQRIRQHQQQQRMKYKNGTRMSLSFTNERMREIERHNQILVRKIFQQSPSPQVMVSTFTHKHNSQISRARR